MHDQLAMAAASVCFNIIGNYYREELGVETDFLLPSERVIRAPYRIIEWHGKLWVIRCYNDPEHISVVTLALTVKHGM